MKSKEFLPLNLNHQVKDDKVRLQTQLLTEAYATTLDGNTIEVGKWKFSHLIFVCFIYFLIDTLRRINQMQYISC